MNNYIREPINGLTHFIGAILSVFALIAMLIKGYLHEANALTLTAIIIFGVSMILLYSTSATFHMIISSEKIINLWQRLDHSMIFLLIAGSYAPFCLISLHGTTGWILFTVILIMATSGMLFKLFWFKCPRFLSTLIYITMGWMALFVFHPLLTSLNKDGLLFLILGGVLYTVGGIIYAFQPKCLSFKHLGFHEIFHIFIMLGSLYHFICIYQYVI